MGKPKDRGLVKIESNDPMVLSAYHSALPESESIYAPLRDLVIQQAVEMGYERHTMVVHPLSWANDLDGNNHVRALTYMNAIAEVTTRFVESFATSIGVETYYTNLNAANGKGIVCYAKTTSIEYKGQCFYPDVLLTAMRLTRLLPHSFQIATATWSLRQQIVVAEGTNEAFFVDASKAKRISLEDAGGTWPGLYADLQRRMKDGNASRRRMSETLPEQKSKGKKSKL